MTEQERDNFRKLALILAAHVDNLQRLATTLGARLAATYSRSDEAIVAMIEVALMEMREDGRVSYQLLRKLKELKRRIRQRRMEDYETMRDDSEKSIAKLIQNEDKWSHAWILAMLALFPQDDTGKTPVIRSLTSSSMDEIRRYGVYNGGTVAGILEQIREQDLARIDASISNALMRMREEEAAVEEDEEDEEEGAERRQGSMKSVGERLQKDMAKTQLQLKVNALGIVNGVSNDVSVLVAQKNTKVISGVMWVTALDDKVCDDCEAYEGQTFPASQAPPCPMHHNCRCHLVPVTIKVSENGGV